MRGCEAAKRPNTPSPPQGKGKGRAPVSAAHQVSRPEPKKPGLFAFLGAHFLVVGAGFLW
jgi:hypothetical protein